MSDKESCTICLDQLFQDTKSNIITRLQPCGHFYHTDCITLWTDKSNSCPTCRRDFDFVETINHFGEILTSERAHKKIIEHVEEYFDGYSEDEMMAYDDDDILERRINNMIARSNICILCDSRHGNVSPCNSCSSTFHLSCLGATNLSRWFCPMCDAEQVNFERPSIFRRSRNSAVTNRVYNSFRGSLLTSPVTVEVKENAKPMSVEEQQSWEIFEIAKKDKSEEPLEASPTATISTTGSSIKKFKQPSRRGIRRGNNGTGSSTQGQAPKFSTPSVTASTPKSLINTILDQMKESNSRDAILPAFTPKLDPVYTQSLPLSPSSSTSSNGSSPQPTIASLSTSPERDPVPTSNKSIWKMSIPNNTLTLEQKSTLQEIVRNRLRPIYKDGTIDVDQYTEINKKVSHILYETCLNESEDYDFEQLADYHVTQEVMEL